jgi:precorrin-2 dehydrogenase / sirohydrochlorin ferrochelatase
MGECLRECRESDGAIMPAYYPLHLDLTGKLCLVVGGGPVAERKVAGLLEVGASVRVVCIEATPGLRRMADAGEIDLVLAAYETRHLTGACLAFAATDREEINARVAADAAAQNVWINRADLYEAGDFIVPAIVRRGDLCLSISTGGNQPLLTARLAEELAQQFGPDYGDYIALLGRLRTNIKTRTASPQTRKAAMQALLIAQDPLRQALATGDTEAAVALAERLLAPILGADNLS